MLAYATVLCTEKLLNGVFVRDEMVPVDRLLTASGTVERILR